MRYIPLLLGFGASLVICAPGAYALGEYVERFFCGPSTSAAYTPRAGKDGFGATNLFVEATMVTSRAEERNAGYICEVLDQKPPTAATTFESLRLCYQLDPAMPGAFDNSKIEFHFKLANGTEKVFTKKFSEMTKTEVKGNTYVSVKAENFTGLASPANLTKFIPYLSSVPAGNIFFGDFLIVTAKETYPLPKLQISYALCPVIPPVNK
ncbi:MAG: hypothetical protein K2Z81_05910 [Cyanobacteria bacterium]|nr:hypothetical protein [Cyanobacteriota bacterium]